MLIIDFRQREGSEQPPIITNQPTHAKYFVINIGTYCPGKKSPFDLSFGLEG